MSFFRRIPNSTLLFFIILLIFLEILFYFLIKTGYLNIKLGGGSDANYYHSYAIGEATSITSSWPVLLAWLNSLGIYSRAIISYLLLTLHLFIIPWLALKLANTSTGRQQKEEFYLYLVCLIYPTLYFYTMDIYRDVFMLFSFLFSCLLVKKGLYSKSVLPFLVYFILAFLAGIWLISLRPYLGYAFLISLVLWKIKLTKKRLFILAILYLLLLFIANSLGIFESLTEYREGFGNELQGGSNLGLDFSNPAMFLPNFILSIFGQLFGLYLVNPFAVLLFIVETIPVLCMLVFIVKNIRYADNFIRFLIIFFIIYASVWLIGNDNLGTAVRLRLYNYLVVYICFFYILRLKLLSIKLTHNLVHTKRG